MNQAIGINPALLSDDELVALFHSLTAKDDGLSSNLYSQRDPKERIAQSVQPLLMELWRRRLLLVYSNQERPEAVDDDDDQPTDRPSEPIGEEVERADRQG